MCEGLVNSCATKTADLLNVTKMAIIDDDALFNSLAPAVNVLTEYVPLSFQIYFPILFFFESTV